MGEKKCCQNGCQRNLGKTMKTLPVISLGVFFTVVIFMGLLTSIYESPKFEYLRTNNFDGAIENKVIDIKDEEIKQMNFSQFKKMRFQERIIGDNQELQDLFPHLETDCNLCEYPSYKKNFFYFGTNEVQYFADAMLRTDLYNADKEEQDKTIITVVASVDEKDTIGKKRKEIEILKDENKKIFGVLRFVNPKFENTIVQCSTHYPKQIFGTLSINCNFPEEIKKEKKGCFYISLFFEDSKKSVIKGEMLVRNCVNDQLIKKKKNVGICTMSHQLDLKDLVEWIEYNFMLGVNHIYIYNHLGLNMDDKYDTGIWTLLDSYIAKGKVDVLMWNFTYPHFYRSERGNRSKYAGDQIGAFNDCLYRFGSNYKFLGFIDQDEFLVPVKEEKIYDVLKKYEVNQRKSISRLDSHAKKTKTHIVNLSSYVYMHSRFIMDPVKGGNPLDLITKRYPHVDNKHVPGTFLPGYYRKTFIEPKNCQFYHIHDCATSSDRRDVQFKSYYFDHTKEMYISHYYWKKYDPINPFYQDYFIKKPKKLPITRFLDKLEKRVRSIKKKIKNDYILSLGQSTIPVKKLNLEYDAPNNYLFPTGYYQNKQNLGKNPKKLIKRVIP